MNWKDQLHTLEKTKQWDLAIELMEDVIKENPNDMEAYIFMNFLLMNLLVEEFHDESKHDYYEMLAKKYFKESYGKFSDSPEYLYYTGITAHMSEWYFDIEREFIDAMIQKAIALEPNSPVYTFDYYWALFEKDQKNPDAIEYAKMLLSPNSPVKKILDEYGAVGEHIWEMWSNCCRKIVGIEPYLP